MPSMSLPSSILIYLIPCGFIIACSMAGLFYANDKRWAYSISSVIVLATMALMIAPYHPVVAPATGYQMHNLTEPAFFLQGWKNAATILEWNPCNYHLLGWQEETLFYQENCWNGMEKIWKFTADRSQTAEQYTGTLPTDLQATLLSGSDVSAVVNWFQPQALKTNSEFSDIAILGLALRNGIMLSPNHRLAVVAQQHVYGPEDVLVLSK